jgi:hypothetical protein
MINSIMILNYKSLHIDIYNSFKQSENSAIKLITKEKFLY